ncbi:hypothetical protein D3C78_541040 [compost metagenome]
MIVHVIGAELGIVQLRHEPAHSQTILAAIGRFVVFQTREVRVTTEGLGASGQNRQSDIGRNPGSQVRASGNQTVVATLGHGVSAEECAAVVDDGLLPLQLVEGLRRDVLAQPLGDIEHVYRDQAFLHLGARTAQGGDVDRVDHVDAVLDEGAFAPAHYLLAEARITGPLAQVVVVVDERIEEFGAGGLGQVFATAVVDIVEQSVLVLQFEVIPVLAAHKDAAVTVLQLQVMQALEDLREGLALLEVQAAIVHGRGARTALAHGVVRRNVIRVSTARCPTGANRQRRIELAFDFTNIEVNGTCLSTKPQSNGGAQQTRLKRSAHHYSCHAALRLRYQREPHPMQRNDRPRIASRGSFVPPQSTNFAHHSGTEGNNMSKRPLLPRLAAADIHLVPRGLAGVTRGVTGYLIPTARSHAPSRGIQTKAGNARNGHYATEDQFMA